MLREIANRVREAAKSEAAPGIMLMIAAILAMVCANTDLRKYYDLFLSTPVAISVGDHEIAKPLLLWINHGLMTMFFFLVGLELKREMLQGHLRERSQIILPAFGAVGGMAIPALIYVAINWDNPAGLKGWAIPAATDIAFALGILVLHGSRVPTSLKLFLISLAIFDDVGAVIIIAIFYTSNISLLALSIVAACIPVLYLLNHLKVESKTMYGLVGLIMWIATLKSGVHATLSGILLAAFIPMQGYSSVTANPLKSFEKDLHSVVNFVILPAFAFANAGISFAGTTIGKIFHDVPMGIAAGLFIGKQLGVFTCCWLAIQLGLAKLPSGVNWRSLYGTAILCGIGFTMSLFIGGLAFEESGEHFNFDDRLGIIAGSLISGVVGYLVLAWSLPKKPKPKDEIG